ncbi:MAG: GDSL-type esterase/lipase family protein, partial [Actinomycetota bacterium]|nr:GDSL-type esterase/lipase family protein [Actinomycetota bacterium]
GVLATVGAWFVFRGDGLVFLVLIGFVLAWALVDRSTGEIDELEAGTPAVLAFGDSFISGEGAETFLAGTNTSWGDNNTCRRAPSAFPVLAAAGQDPPMAVHSFACSGAVTDEITSVAQKENVGSDVAGWLPQLDSLTSTDPVFIEPDDLDAAEVALVSIGGNVALVSIGGNDAEFGTIVKSCLLPTDCSEDAEAWFALAESIEDDLVDTYEAIEDALPATADVVVVPYPRFISPEGCDRVISDDEVAFVDDLVTVLNGTIHRAADRAGVLVADTADTFEGHRHCDDEPGANLIVLAPEDGSVVERLDPSTWVHGSMHPWELGHELQAEVLTPLVAALAAGDDADEWLVDLDAVVAEPTVALDERSDLIATLPSEDDPDWVQDELYATATRIVWPIGLLLIGGLLVALGGSRAGWPVWSFLAPEGPGTPHRARGDRKLHLFSLASGPTGATLLVVAASLEEPSEASVRGDDGTGRCSFGPWHHFAGGRHPFWWAKCEIDGLATGTAVSLRATAEGYDDSPPAVVTTTPPADTSSLSMVVGSCFDRENATAPAGLTGAYDRLVDPDDTEVPPLHFWLGDQVYVDAPWTAGLRAADAWDTVAGKYLDAWEAGPAAACPPTRDPERRFGALLRRSSNWFLPDDHELWNGYPELSYVTLTHHAVKRALRQAFRKVFRSDSDPHPATQGTFGEAAGEGYAVFQSPVDFERFDETVSPPQVQELDLDAVRVLVADTRWSRTIRRYLPGSGFMLAEDLDHLISRLDTDKLVVLMVARPMLGHPPKGRKRFAVDVGFEYYGEQYTKLCRALYARTQAGRPTLLIGGDVHYHAIRRAVDGRLLELVCSPMSLLGGEQGAAIMGMISSLRGLVSKVLPGRRAPDACFPHYDADGNEIRPRQAGVTDLHLTEDLGFHSGLVRVDLDLADRDRPIVNYRCAQVGDRGFETRHYTWDAADGWRRSTAGPGATGPAGRRAPGEPLPDVDDHLINGE